MKVMGCLRVHMMHRGQNTKFLCLLFFFFVGVNLAAKTWWLLSKQFLNFSIFKLNESFVTVSERCHFSDCCFVELQNYTHFIFLNEQNGFAVKLKTFSLFGHFIYMLRYSYAFAFLLVWKVESAPVFT